MQKSKQKKTKPNIFSLIITAGIAIWIIYSVVNSEDSSIIDKTASEELPVRKPAVAGSFYNSDGIRLKEQIEGFFDAVSLETNGAIKILISPHAGYEYSGQVAAYGC